VGESNKSSILSSNPQAVMFTPQAKGHLWKRYSKCYAYAFSVEDVLYLTKAVKVLNESMELLQLVNE
jgi:hypothetical protein